jgi:hypothetical protein
MLLKTRVVEEFVEDDDASASQPIIKGREHVFRRAVDVAVYVDESDRVRMTVKKARQRVLKQAGDQLNIARHLRQLAASVEILVGEAISLPVLRQAAKTVKSVDAR